MVNRNDNLFLIDGSDRIRIFLYYFGKEHWTSCLPEDNQLIFNAYSRIRMEETFWDWRERHQVPINLL
jgi:hypothetical protein